MDKTREQYLVDLCDKLKRTIIAYSVVQAPQYRVYDNPDPTRKLVFRLEDCAKSMALTILMCLMGYKIPKSLYGLQDFSDLCGWLDENDVLDE